MAVLPGTRIGPYEIGPLLGEGGMGRVFRARDTSLNRSVAIKILPDALAVDPDRLARFRREAEALAALNHPHIAQIYGFEQSGVIPAIAMELVEGPTLADRLQPGPLPLDEAIAIAGQIAEALEAAHERGIVHRDLKPANIKVQDDGAVKVLDFGLATAIEPPGEEPADMANSPTLTARATQIGIVLGTAAYMAPEQAKGKRVDKRADVWAFGVVLFEMLSGRRPFDGTDVTEVMARVIDREPDWALLPNRTPRAIERLLRRCLVKDRNRRLRDIGDARLELDEAAAEPREVAGAAPVAGRPPWRRALPVAAGMALTALAAWALWPVTRAPQVIRFEERLPDGERQGNTTRQSIAISRDGHSLLFSSGTALILRRMDDLTGRPIPGVSGSLASPFFSPDGQTVGFFDRDTNQLMRVSIAGGRPAAICSADNPNGVSWESDETILFAQAEGIFRVPSSGGTPSLVVKAQAGEQLQRPQLLPGGDSVLVTVTDASGNGEHIGVHSIRSGKRHDLHIAGRDAGYVSTGHLVYGVDNTLYAVPFDAEALAVAGEPVAVAHPVDRSFTSPSVMFYAVSEAGVLAYLAGDAMSRGAHLSKRLVWVSRAGIEEPIAADPGLYYWLDISPRGDKVVVDTVEATAGDLLIHTFGSGVFDRLTSEMKSLMGVWSTDNRHVAYAGESNEGGRDLFIVPADASAPPRAFATAEYRLYPSNWLEDGRLIAVKVDADGDRDLVIFGPDGGAPAPLVETEYMDTRGQVSPDGRWLVYVSNHTGERQVFVRPFGSAGGRTPVSPAQADNPRWSPDGRALYYMHAGFLWSVAVAAEPGPWVSSEPQRLFPLRDYFVGTGFWQGIPYDVHPTTGKFLMLKRLVDGDSAASVHVALNWFEELKRVAPVR